MRRLTTVLLLLALALVTMGQESCDTGETEKAGTETETTDSPDDTGAEEDEPPSPDPQADVESNCDYLLSFSEDLGGADAHKFVAGATITNTGNIGIVVRLKASWTLLGGEPVTAEKTARVKRGGEREVQISMPATSEQIDAHQSANGKCRAKGTIVDTFGNPK